MGTFGYVPGPFVDGDHFAGVAGDSAVGEEVGRVGEDKVDGIFRNGREDFQAVALVDAEVVFGVVEGGRWESRGRFGHDDDRSGSLITTVMVSSGRETTDKEKDLTQRAQRKESTEFAEKNGAGWKPALQGGGPANREISVPGGHG